jgi:hypothetical protein
MNRSEVLTSGRRIGTGLAFVIFPLVFIFAFAVHPGLLNPRLLGPEELILRGRNNDLLQFAHALVTLNTALLVVIALHFMRLLDRGPQGRPKIATGICLSSRSRRASAALTTGAICNQS